MVNIPPQQPQIPKDRENPGGIDKKITRQGILGGIFDPFYDSHKSKLRIGGIIGAVAGGILGGTLIGSATLVGVIVTALTGAIGAWAGNNTVEKLSEMGKSKAPPQPKVDIPAASIQETTQGFMAPLSDYIQNVSHDASGNLPRPQSVNPPPAAPLVPRR